METTSPSNDTMSVAQNRSDTNFLPLSHVEAVILEILTLIFALVGLLGNTVVFCILGFCVKRNAISVYILNLATSDFLFLCCHFILSVCLFSGKLGYSHYYTYLRFVGRCSYNMGLFMLSAISFERCLAVLFPIWYQCNRPRHMSTAICALFWAVSLLFAILRYIFCNFPFGSYKLCITMRYTIGSSLIFDFVILCGSSLTLLVRVLCSARRLRLTRLYVTIWLTVLVFLFCGLPVGIFTALATEIKWKSSTFFTVRKVVYLLSSINSSANPIIYFLVGSFRQKQQQQQQQQQPWSLKLILQKALEDIGDREKSGQFS